MRKYSGGIWSPWDHEACRLVDGQERGVACDWRGTLRQLTRTMSALCPHVALPYSVLERKVYWFGLSSKAKACCLSLPFYCFVPRPFRSAVRLSNQPFRRPFPTPPWFFRSIIRQQPSILRHVAYHKSCEICPDCSWQHFFFWTEQIFSSSTPRKPESAQQAVYQHARCRHRGQRLLQWS